MKIILLLLLNLTLFANHPFIYSADFEWSKDRDITKNHSVINDDNVSYSWKIWFNDEFTKAYDGKTVKITEVYEAEYACWHKSILQDGQLSDDNLTYTKTLDFPIHRYIKEPTGKTYQQNGYWCLSVGEVLDEEACKAFEKHISHDKIHVYVNDTLLHTFEFTITPKDYNQSVERQAKEETSKKATKHKQYTPPNYANMYPNTPQIVLPKVHIYDVKKLSYFRNKKDIIFIESSSGNYAIPRQEFTNAKYLLLTKELKERLKSLEIN